MSILGRFGDIISANINALLDKAEDPEKMIDQYLRNAMEDLAAVKEETTGVMAEEKRCKRLLDDAVEGVTRFDGLARKALQAGNEGDARTFIAEKQKIEATVATAQKNYDIAKANADKMRQMHDKLAADIEALKARRNNVKATMAVARTQERVNEAAEAFNGARGSIAAFERMEDKAQAMLDQANAAAELSAGPENSAEALAEKYAGGGDASVDDELAKMKAQLGM